MISPALNPLVLSLKESATLAVNLKALDLRRRGREVFHFGFGQSPFPVPDRIQEGLRRNADKKDYLPTQGLPELREAVSRFYREEFGYDFSSDDVCIGPGSKELIFETLYLVEGVLLVPAPSWVSYGPQASLRGKSVAPILTRRENGYRLTAEELDRTCHRLAQAQKLLILNNPNNPTGSVYREEEIRELVEICRAYQVLVVSDEIYAMINFTGEPHCSVSQHYPEGTIVTGGLSKTFAAGGYRLGVILVPRQLNIILQALKSVISETFSAVSSPIQYAAVEAYGSFDAIRPFVEKTCQIHQFAGEYLHKRFIEMGLNCPKPEGAFYLFPDFEAFREPLRSKSVFTGPRLCDRLLEEAGVAVLPGSDFYLPATHLGVRAASVDYDGAKALDAWTGPRDVTPEGTTELFPRLVEGCDRLERFLQEL